MKKWITILGIVVSLVILLLIETDGRKMLHKKNTGSKVVGLEK